MTIGHMRGSSLLLVGRFLSLGMNFVVQLLIARYLSQTEYGAWAYALSLVVLGETITTLGLDRGVGRFLAVYDEEKDYARLAGTLLLVAGVVVSIGLTLVLLVIGVQSWLRETAIGDEQAVALIVILIFLAPIQSADNLLGGVLAVFASARAIFLRRYVLTPMLKLSVVLLLVLTSQDVAFLAKGYVLVGGVGLLLYGGIVWRMLGDRGIRRHLRPRSARIPFREVLGFTIPLLSTDLVVISMTTVDAMLLQHFWGTVEVAEYRVVQPLANLNLVVYTSFTLLFTPAAARLFARHEAQGVADLYWKTAVWVAVFSFPMFALTTTLAGPVTELLYEPRYADSAVFLAIVSVGYYVNAAFGFNGATLRVCGFVRYTLVSNLIIVIVNVSLNLALIPRMGALGAAIATATTLVLHNAVKQYGLHGRTSISVFDWRYVRVYAVITAAIVVLAAIQWLFAPPFGVGLALAAGASVLVVIVNRRLLDVANTFPEVLRVPGARRFLGS
jgi:O-antigen/teichoic acid export membrane protein